MNERIKELAKQCGWLFLGDETGSLQPDPEKFAELIAKECITLAGEIALKNWVKDDTYSAGKKAGAFEVARTIKQHFGVEEWNYD